jgi:hypothetical protein
MAGLMVYEQFFDHHEGFWGWRFIFCGEIVDDLIIENRQWLRKGVESGDKKAQSVLGKK